MSHKINDGLTTRQRHYLRLKSDPEKYAKKLAGARRSYARHAQARRNAAKAKWPLIKASLTEKDRERIRQNALRSFYRHEESRRAKQREWIIGRIRQIQELKEQTPCMDCGQRHPHYVMEFDHREPELKVAPMCQFYNRKWDVIKAEIAKCDIVCANCHNTRTWLRKQL